jgi:energy-coupling factor transporter ATP-binding protein EcfA2
MINDMKFVKGQEAAKRAIEIGVLGCHSMLLYGPSGSGKSTLAECTLALASTTDAILILDDIDLDCNVRQLRRDLDHGLWIIATAAEIPTDFAIVDRFPIVLMLNRLHAADLILPPPAKIVLRSKNGSPRRASISDRAGRTVRASTSCATTRKSASCRRGPTRTP